MTVRASSIARTAAVLSRNPLGLLALCLVIGEAIASIFLLHPGGLHGPERVLLCLFVVAYPPCVVAAIYRLVSRHHTKLYAPADFRDERCFLEVLSLTGAVQPVPLPSIHAIAGDDFQLIASAPAANGGPRLEPGVYLQGSDAYYVTRRQQLYLLRCPGAPQLPREIRALPDGCRLLPRQDWDRELQALADAAEQIAGR
jgi:hypothetical protein